MTDQKSSSKPRRLSKGQRLHIRRLKQAADKDPIIIRSITKKGS